MHSKDPIMSDRYMYVPLLCLIDIIFDREEAKPCGPRINKILLLVVVLVTFEKYILALNRAFALLLL